MVRIGINGLGRIGRAVFRLAQQDPSVEIVAVNNRSDGEVFPHLLNHDSVYGKAPFHVAYEKKQLVVDGTPLPFYHEDNPANISWKKHEVDVVIESTGVFEDGNLARKHITAGAKRVLITAPAVNVDFDIVYGINHTKYNPKKHYVISNQSCTTNCATPLVYVLHEEFGIATSYLLTAHAYTSTQLLLDNKHKDLRRARAAALNIVPTTTGAADAVVRILPHLKGRLTGLAVRVPVPVGSMLALVAELETSVTPAHINRVMKRASETFLRGVLEYSTAPLVSSDVIGNPHSAIFDSQLTRVQRKTFVEIMSWYDNEWGYAARCIDVAKML